MFRVLSASIVTLFFLAAPLSAANLDQAKASGHACELPNGYLRANAGAPGDVKAMVDNINGQRRAQYTRIANDNGVEVDQVAKLTAQKVIGAAPQFACK